MLLVKALNWRLSRRDVIKTTLKAFDAILFAQISLDKNLKELFLVASLFSSN